MAALSVQYLKSGQQKRMPCSSHARAKELRRALFADTPPASARVDEPCALALAGGVSANRALRGALARECEEQGIRFCCPDFRYCTDNAAMIACAGHYALMAGELSGLDLNAAPELPLVQR